MKKLCFILSTVLLCLFLPAVLFAQNKKTIIVRVIDAASQRNLEGAVVKLKDGISLQQTTGADGTARFEITISEKEKDILMEVTYGTFPFREHLPYMAVINIGKEELYTVTAPLKSSAIRINVNVTDAAKGLPVSAATVTIKLYEKTYTAETDDKGNASIDFDIISSIKLIPVEASKAGYRTGGEAVTYQDNVRSYAVSLKLTLETNTRVLQVFVVNEKNEGIADAGVTVRDRWETVIAKGTTDNSGNALIACPVDKDYRVIVKHDNFEPAETAVRLKEEETGAAELLSFTLKRKTFTSKDLRPLKVTVVDKKTGKAIAGAEVQTEADRVKTNGAGLALFGKVVALGNIARVKVTANDYKEVEQSYVGGGEDFNKRYTLPEGDELRFELEKTGNEKVKLIVEVIDYQTQLPLKLATVIVKNMAGQTVMTALPTTTRGRFAGFISGKALQNPPLRVMAKATNYEDNWSDISSDFIHAGDDTLLFTINLRKIKTKTVKEAMENKYGPYYVPSSKWEPTHITFKKGDYFRVEAGNYFTAKDGSHIGPGGGGYWTWWTLAGRIGGQKVSLGKDGGATVTEGGELELGTPRGLGSNNFVQEDIDNLSGSLLVYVYTAKGVFDNTEFFKQAENDLDWLKRLQKADPSVVKTMTSDEISQHFKWIAQQYKLYERKCNVEHVEYTCAELIKRLYDNITLMAEEKECYNLCLLAAINELENKIRNKMLY